jgi:hypothetical protein
MNEEVFPEHFQIRDSHMQRNRDLKSSPRAHKIVQWVKVFSHDFRSRNNSQLKFLRSLRYWQVTRRAGESRDIKHVTFLAKHG